MKTRDGTALERLVALIESRLVPAGFEVETRKRVFNDVGVQVAEFDIVISGPVGTSDVSVLVECRDRPADGAAPLEWIQQLVGRRLDCGFDKVMAVSSTGFSPGAAEAAERQRVELRHLQSLTPDDVVDWLLPRKPPLVIHRHHLSAVRLLCLAPESASRLFRIDEEVLVETQSGARTSAIDLWRNVVGTAAVWNDVRVGAPVEKTIQAGKHITERYSLEMHGRLFPVESIEFDARLEAVPVKMRLAEMGQYADVSADSQRSRPLADVARWVADDDTLVKEMTIIGIRKREAGSDVT